MQSVVLKCDPETQHEVNESQKRGTATEHATQPVVLVQVIEGARADRADDSLEHLLLKLADFLTFVMRQLYWNWPQHLETDGADITGMVLGKISEWADTPNFNFYYNTSELLPTCLDLPRLA